MKIEITSTTQMRKIDVVVVKTLLETTSQIFSKQIALKFFLEAISTIIALATIILQKTSMHFLQLVKFTTLVNMRNFSYFITITQNEKIERIICWIKFKFVHKTSLTNKSKLITLAIRLERSLKTSFDKVSIDNINSYFYLKKLIRNLKNIYEENSDNLSNRHEQKLFNNLFFMSSLDKKNESLKQFLARFMFIIASLQLLDKSKINHLKRTIATRYVLKENFNLKKMSIFQKHVANIRKSKTSLKNVNNRLKSFFMKYFKSRVSRSINSFNFIRKMLKIIAFINYLRRFFSQVQKKIKEKKRCDKCFQLSHVYTQLDASCKNKKSINMKKKQTQFVEFEID